MCTVLVQLCLLFLRKRFYSFFHGVLCTCNKLSPMVVAILNFWSTKNLSIFLKGSTNDHSDTVWIKSWLFKKAFIQLPIGCYIKNCVGGHLGLSNNTENSNSNRLLQSHLKTFQQYHYEICPSRKHCLFHYYNIMFYCNIRASCATKLIFYTISQIYIKKGLRWLGPIGEWPLNFRG